MESNIGFMNNIFRIKKLFTEAYYDCRFSSLFIPTINNMVNMVVPGVQRLEYNDAEKYVEIAAATTDKNPLGSYIYDVMIGFITFCFEDHVMRNILMEVDLNDFKVFDQTMQAIREAQSLGVNNKTLTERYLVINVFNIIIFNNGLIRLNLT